MQGRGSGGSWIRGRSRGAGKVRAKIAISSASSSCSLTDIPLPQAPPFLKPFLKVTCCVLLAPPASRFKAAMADAAFEKASLIEEELEVAVAAARSTDLISTVATPAKSYVQKEHTESVQ